MEKKGDFKRKSRLKLLPLRFEKRDGQEQVLKCLLSEYGP